jgi:MoxR-like ATPase
MSCEENRFRYFERVSATGGALANALGGETESRAVLEQIFNTARNDGAAIRSPLQQHKAAGRTLQLFEEMERAHGLARPTHSTKGMRLPRRDAQFGYQAVYDTIEAARTGKALPDVAVRVMQQRQLRRTVSSLHLDDHGYYRCANCGQFASRTRSHMCPLTATSPELERALQRRLGTPAGAYVFTNPAGQRVDGLQELIDAARAAPSAAPGGAPGLKVRMIHCLTGEEADVTLDGAIPALSQGFVPGLWAGRHGLSHVELADRRVVAVLNASGLNAIDPTSVLGGSGTVVANGANSANSAPPVETGSGIGTVQAVQAAAAAYGTALIPGTIVHSLGMPNTSPLSPMVQSADRPSVPRVPLVPDVPFVSPVASLARSAVGTAASKPVLLKPTELQGGVAYDWGHFTGTEYRKGGSHGATVSARGRTYKVGDRSLDPNDWAHARRTGAEPAPKGGVAVGRTLVAAVEALSNGHVVINGEGQVGGSTNGKGKGSGSSESVQLYNADGSELLAVYDHAMHVAGDTGGTPNASAEQMAAVLAYWERFGHDHPDVSPPAVRSLVADLEALRRGGGSPLAVADSAYLVMRDQLSGGSSLMLGAHVSTPRCPDCGRWMGDLHNCPVRAQADAQTQVQSQEERQIAAPSPEPDMATAAPVTMPIPPTPPTPPTPVTPAVTEGSDTSAPQVAGTLYSSGPVDQASPTFTPELTDAFDRLGDRLGERLGERMGSVLGERLGGLGDSLAAHLGSAQQAQSAPTQPSPPPPPPVDERMVFALERLAAVLQEWPLNRAAEQDALAGEGADASGGKGPGQRRTSSRGSERQSQSATSRPVASPVPPEPPEPPARPPLDVLPLTPQEYILKHVKPPEAPDPYLTRLDMALGGQRAEPLRLHYEEIDPAYDVSAGAEKALRIVSSSLQIAWDPDRKKALRGTHMRVFGFAGTAGTGKNTTARQVAASLGLPYYETTLHRDSSLQEEIGQTVLQDGTTMPKLGPLGQAAAAGGVICINELVKANPGTLGALQRMMEDGVFEVQGTEAGLSAKEIPVHPSTVFICTWNPGYDGSSDRPDAALLSRIPTVRMDAPDIKDETRRLMGSLGALFGVEDGATGVDSKASQQKEERLQEIQGRDYSIKKSQPSAERVEIAVRFVRDLRNLAQTRQIGASSRHLLEPTPREALHFAAICEATGDPLLALEQFKIYCDSGEGYDEQFKLVQQIFKRYYGEDGQALNRRANGAGPQQS